MTKDAPEVPCYPIALRKSSESGTRQSVNKFFPRQVLARRASAGKSRHVTTENRNLRQ